MANVVMASFNTDQIGSTVFVQAEDGFGVLTAAVTGTLFPSVSGIVDTLLYASAIDDLVAQLNDAGGSWTGGYVFNENKFFLSSSTGYKLTMNGFTKRLFGFVDSPTTFVQYTTSSTDPYYIFVTEEGGRQRDTEVYERNITYREDVTDDGRTFGLPNNGNTGYSFLGVNRQDGFMIRDWEYTNESIWKVFTDYSSTLSPYTWQEHQTYSRSFHPWVVFDYNSASNATYDDRQATFRFRGEESQFKPTPMFPNQSQFWTIPVRARQLSRGNNFGIDPFLVDEFGF